MPKMKTHKATARRFKVSAGGKLMRVQIGKSHLRRRKAKRVRGLFDEYLTVTQPANVRRVRRLAPALWKHR